MILRVSNEISFEGLYPILLEELRDEFTVLNPAFVQAEKHGHWTGDIEPTLEFFSYRDGILTVPRGAGRRVLEIVQKYGELNIMDERLSLEPLNLSFEGKLRPYQQQAVSGILAKDFGVLEAGTGSGKTVMALAVIAARRQPTLVLVHTKELLYQWRDRIKTFLGVDAGLVGDGKLDVQPITVGIVHTVRKNLDLLAPRFGQVVVDECHHVPSTLFSEALRAFPAKYMLGLSATPYRRDGLNSLIGWFVGLHRVPVDPYTLKQVGAVLRPKIITRKTDFFYPYDDDYARMISAMVDDLQRNFLIIDDILTQVQQGRLALVVSDRTAHLEELFIGCGEIGEILTGKTPKKKRQAIVADLQEGKIPVLFSTLSLIGEGFDCPAMDALFLASPIKFSGRLKQTVGRVLRPSDGKQPVVFDYVDHQVPVLKYQAKARQRVFNELCS